MQTTCLMHCCTALYHACISLNGCSHHSPTYTLQRWDQWLPEESCYKNIHVIKIKTRVWRNTKPQYVFLWHSLLPVFRSARYLALSSISLLRTGNRAPNKKPWELSVPSSLSASISPCLQGNMVWHFPVNKVFLEQKPDMFLLKG